MNSEQTSSSFMDILICFKHANIQEISDILNENISVINPDLLARSRRYEQYFRDLKDLSSSLILCFDTIQSVPEFELCSSICCEKYTVDLFRPSVENFFDCFHKLASIHFMIKSIVANGKNISIDGTLKPLNADLTMVSDSPKFWIKFVYESENALITYMCDREPIIPDDDLQVYRKFNIQENLKMEINIGSFQFSCLFLNEINIKKESDTEFFNLCIGPVSIHKVIPNDSKSPYIVKVSPLDSSFEQPKILIKGFKEIKPCSRSICIKIIANSGRCKFKYLKLSEWTTYMLDFGVGTFFYKPPISPYGNVELVCNFLPDRADCFDLIDSNGNVSKFEVVSYMSFRFESLSFGGTYKALDANLTIVGDVQLKIISEQIFGLHQAFVGLKTFYAPISSLIQSSGSGKTKICLDLIKSCPGIYMVLRKSSDSGIPFEQSWMRKFFNFVLQGNCSDDVPYLSDQISGAKATEYSPSRFLLALNHVAESYLKKLTKLKQELTVDEAIMHLAKRFCRLPYENDSQKDNFLDEIIFESLEGSDSNIKQIIEKISATLNIILSFRTDSPSEKTFPFLLILDEADYLNEMPRTKDHKTGIRALGFNVVRRGLHLLDTNVKLMVIALGTNSDVLDFSPSGKDDSMRDFNRPNLLPPLFLPGNFDIFFQNYPVHNLVLNRDLLLSESLFKLLVVMGRPLWASLELSKLMNIAIAKLKNGDQYGVAASFALLSTRANINVNPNHVLSRTLIQSYMIIASYVSTDARDLIVSYSSEPILALASRDLLSNGKSTEIGKDPKERAFAALRYLSGRQAIDIGRIVEYLFEIFNLFAVDEAKEFEGYPLPKISTSVPEGVNPALKPLLSYKQYALELRISENAEFERQKQRKKNEPESSIHGFSSGKYKIIEVAHFIYSSFGAQVFKNVAALIPSKILHGLVNISHFVNLEKITKKDLYGSDVKVTARDNEIVIDKSLLKCGLMRQCGFVMPPGYFGIDFIIPFAFEWDSEKNTSYSFIAVQCKTSPESVQNCSLKMDFKHHLIKCPKCYPSDKCLETCSSTFAYKDDEYKEVCSHQLTLLSSFTAETEKRPKYKSTFMLKGEQLLDVKALTDLQRKAAKVKEEIRLRKLAHDNFADLFKAHATFDHKNEESNTTSNIKAKAFPLFEKVKKSLIRPDVIISTSFPCSIGDKETEAFTIQSMKWNDTPRHLICLVSRSAKIYKHLMSGEAFNEARFLAESNKSALDKVDALHFDLVQYSLHRGRFSNFFYTNPLLRSMRNLPSVIDRPREESCYSNFDLINSSVDICSKNVVEEDASRLTLSNIKLTKPDFEKEEDDDFSDSEEDEKTISKKIKV